MFSSAIIVARGKSAHHTGQKEPPTKTPMEVIITKPKNIFPGRMAILLDIGLVAHAKLELFDILRVIKVIHLNFGCFIS